MEDFNDVLAGVPSEGSANPFAEQEEPQETETPAESPAEEEPTEDAPSPEGADNTQDEEKLPFHKHPRWKAMYERNKALEQEVAQTRSEMEERLRQVQESVSSVPRGEEAVPDEFVRLYGDNPEAFRLWRKQQEDFAARVKNEVFQEMQQRQETDQRNLQEGERYVESSLQELEVEGAEFNRNELMKFMLDFRDRFGALPTDDRDNIDFRRGLELMMEMKGKMGSDRQKSQARKDLAAFSSSGGKNSEPPDKDYLTAQDLRNTDWDTLVGR